MAQLCYNEHDWGQLGQTVHILGRKGRHYHFRLEDYDARI